MDNELIAFPAFSEAFPNEATMAHPGHPWPSLSGTDNGFLPSDLLLPQPITLLPSMVPEDTEITLPRLLPPDSSFYQPPPMIPKIAIPRYQQPHDPMRRESTASGSSSNEGSDGSVSAQHQQQASQFGSIETMFMMTTESTALMSLGSRGRRKGESQSDGLQRNTMILIDKSEETIKRARQLEFELFQLRMRLQETEALHAPKTVPGNVVFPPKRF